VIGKIKGTKYPDEWVVLGNHLRRMGVRRGGSNSGTAAMLETVHGFADLLRRGWKPDRTIVFASWDAEEEGLIGSTEWGEEHEKDSGARGGLFQYGCSGFWFEFWRVRGSEPERL